MSGVVQAQCAKKVVVEEHKPDGSVERSELSTALELKKEVGNARLVSDDAMLWVAHAKLQQKPGDDGQHVTVSNGMRSFSFFLESNVESESFLNELRAQVDGKTGLEARRKKRKIRRQIEENQSAGFVPTVNSLRSPLRQPPTTPVKRRLSDSTNSPRLAPPLPLSVSTVSEARGVPPSPAKSPFQSPFRSPFRKTPTQAPRTATPISLSLPPKSPAVLSSSTPSVQSSTSSARTSTPVSLSLTSPRPREWLSPSKGGPVRVQLTPPSIRRTPGSASSARNGSEKENTPVRGGIVNKRVRSLQHMLDEVPREEPENSAGAPPAPIRSPYFLSPPNARELSPMRRPPPGKRLRSPMQPLGEVQLNTTPPPRQLVNENTPPSGALSGPTRAATIAAPRKVTHGLLNLGNYCYMNAIVQSLAALPGFADHLQTDDWLLAIIKKRLGTKERPLPELAHLLSQWKAADESNRLVVQDRLSQLLQQVIKGSENSINPEPLKTVMGRKNARFASLSQQDAHEFLLNLVTEYEKELVTAVEGVVQTIDADGDVQEGTEPSAEPAVAPSQPPEPKRTGLLNFFRREKKPSDNSPASNGPTPSTSKSQAKHKERADLVAQLFPAECFRAELYRTLTCRSCQYSRRQVEQFYDFSLDLPYVAPPSSPTISQPQGEPQPAKADVKQCHCGVDAVIIESGGGRFFSCAKSTCSLREKAEETPDPEPSPHPQDSVLALPATEGDQGNIQRSIQLDDLLKEQFKSEVLELTCEKCKEGKEAIAGYEVKSLPRVLILHLKRFEVNPQTGSLYKRCDLVEAPAELYPGRCIHGAEVKSDEPAKEIEKRYTIRSVVHHLGKTVDEGHYVADVCGARGDWRRRNDTHETMIGEDFALRASRSQESCYMMFYVLSDSSGSAPDKENASTTSSPVRVSRSTTPVTVESPASLVGRRRDNTPPRRDASTVSKSLHNLL